ncbi:nuclear receptor subfamily 0 group B member 1-like [Xyrichtys novacula]|uniref:Nuclear receptor subfamily 0 group B member 1-like n=1 Tax=Xyrichtys novacula TaxID=13765 RepID=A0AAV1HMP1_XYRNO|nr:nuclear receptor subfamily 0 group B member 1-like [Xyrichtys novacula]
MSCYECKRQRNATRGSILFSLLNRDPNSPQDPQKTTPKSQLCSCATRKKLVAIRAPQLVFKAASGVLVKTFRFVKHVPCFRGLPTGDQLRLVRSSWAQLLVLGMVQDCVDFDTVETQQPSLLHEILTHSKNRQQHSQIEVRDQGVPVSDAEGIMMFLVKCRGLRISAREFAFLKGAVLFSLDGTELECRDYIRALHREAERALYEHVGAVYQANRTVRFSRLRAVLSALRSVDPDAVAGLFFRPVLGTGSIDGHVLSLFHER